MEYCRQIFWSSGIDLPKDFERLIENTILAAVEFPPDERLGVGAGQNKPVLERVFPRLGGVASRHQRHMERSCHGRSRGERRLAARMTADVVR